MKKFQVTMVNPQQIAQKGLKGCKTARQVTTFAQKHKVPWTWYKPTPNYRVMLVDWPGFRTAWKENSPSMAKNPITRNHGWTSKTTVRPTTKSRTNPNQKTTYATSRHTAAKPTYRLVQQKPARKSTYRSNTRTSYRTYQQNRRTKRAA